MTQHEFILLPDGRAAFRKFLSNGESGRFRAEADGLRALAETHTVLTPAVLSVGGSEIITSRIEQGDVGPSAWSDLGGQLAALQSQERPCFGFAGDNFCGDTPQPNPRSSDGHAFFAEHRLAFQARLARDAGLLEARDIAAIDSLCTRLERLIPAAPPALLHGDLWRGNVMFDHAGDAVLIDPACYWGWPEADIGMTALFGGFPEPFYRSWEREAQPPPGWRERLPLYNLYHLLNHLNLFGRSYYSGVTDVLRRFG